MMKIVMDSWPPLFARGVAGVIAASGLAAAAALRSESLAVPRELIGRLTLTAAINVFAWMGFTALSLLWLHVSEAALLTFTMPIWANLLAWPALGERPTLRSIIALALGLAGLLTIMGPDLRIGGDKLPGMLLALSAAFLFALGAVTSRRPIPLPPVVLTAWLIGLGSLAMVIVGWAIERPDLTALTASRAAAIAYMAAGPMALCYLAWFAALRRIPTSAASTGILLVPIIGAVLAAAILGEPLGVREFAAFTLTLGGVALGLRGKAPEPDS
jgi:drug/metabolite transporter (DMT)-like permease